VVFRELVGDSLFVVRGKTASPRLGNLTLSSSLTPDLAVEVSIVSYYSPKESREGHA